MRRTVTLVVISAVALALAAPTHAYHAYVSIGARDAPRLWPFDTASNRLVGSPLLRRGGAIGPIAVTPNGKLLYVAVLPRPDGAISTLEILNTATKRRASRGVRLPGVAQLMAVAGRYVYVVAGFVASPSGGPPTVRASVIDALSNRIRRVIPFGPSTVPFDLVSGPDGRRVYFLDGERHLWVIDDRGARILKTVAIPRFTGAPLPAKMAITPDGRSLFVTAGPGLAVISTAAERVVRQIHLPGGPGWGPDALAAAPNGRTLYLAYRNVGPPTYGGPPFIARLRTATNRVIGSPVTLPITFVDNRVFIAVTPNGRKLYATASARSYGASPSDALEIHRVYAISTATNAIIKTVTVFDRVLKAGAPVNGLPVPLEPLEPDSIVFAR